MHWQRLKRGLQEGREHDHFVWSERDELGRGAFGRIFWGTSCYNSTKTVAIKQMPKGKLCSEINVLANLDHLNILRLLEACEDARNFYIMIHFDGSMRGR